MFCKASAPPLATQQLILRAQTSQRCQKRVSRRWAYLQDGRTYFNYHHTAADTLDKIVPGELRENAAAMAVMGYALASMKDPLPR